MYYIFWTLEVLLRDGYWLIQRRIRSEYEEADRRLRKNNEGDRNKAIGRRVRVPAVTEGALRLLGWDGRRTS